MGIRFPAGDWNRYQPAKMVLSQTGEEMAPKDKWWLALRSGSLAMTMWLPSWQGSSSTITEGSVVVVVDLLQLEGSPFYKRHKAEIILWVLNIPQWFARVWSSHESANSEEIMRFVTLVNRGGEILCFFNGKMSRVSNRIRDKSKVY